MPRKIFFTFLILIVAVTSTGCASFGRKLKSWMNGQPDTTQHASATPGVTSFSSTPAVMVGKERKYKRVTKDNFSDDQMLEENAGSLWRKEGQGSYLFSQNNLRMIGDIINVEVEGKAAENLSAKLTVIKQALARLEPPVMVRRPASRPGIPKPEDKPAGDNKQASTDNKTQPTSAEEAKQEEESREKIKDQLVSRFDNVPCRITEKNPDGSYRVKGQSSVYVGRREYKLIVTGVVRPEDLSADEINSSKIIDSKFDLVATNKELSTYR